MMRRLYYRFRDWLEWRTHGRDRYRQPVCEPCIGVGWRYEGVRAYRCPDCGGKGTSG